MLGGESRACWEGRAGILSGEEARGMLGGSAGNAGSGGCPDRRGCREHLPGGVFKHRPWSLSVSGPEQRGSRAEPHEPRFRPGPNPWIGAGAFAWRGLTGTQPRPPPTRTLRETEAQTSAGLEGRGPWWPLAHEVALAIPLPSPETCLNLGPVPSGPAPAPWVNLSAALAPPKRSTAEGVSRSDARVQGSAAHSGLPRRMGDAGKGQLARSHTWFPGVKGSTLSAPLVRGVAVAMAVAGVKAEVSVQGGLSLAAFARLTRNPGHQLQGPQHAHSSQGAQVEVRARRGQDPGSSEEEELQKVTTGLRGKRCIIIVKGNVHQEIRSSFLCTPYHNLRTGKEKEMKIPPTQKILTKLLL